MSAALESSVKMGVLDPIRRLCESHHLQFFIVLQNSKRPKQRFWSSSDQMNNLCGNLIFEFATYVDTISPSPAKDNLELKCEDEFSEIPKTELETITIDDTEDEDVLLPEEELDEVAQEADNDWMSDAEYDLKSNSSKSREGAPTVSRPLSPPSSPLNPLNRHRAPLPSSPLRSDENFEDQFLEDEVDGDNEVASETDSSNLLRNPTIWKNYDFLRPMRRSTIKRLFKDKLIFSKGCHHTSDTEYSPMLLKIIKKANPHCVLYPKRFCRYLIRRDMYLAEFFCRYDSCLINVNVKIDCTTNNVSLALFHRKPFNPPSSYRRPPGRDKEPLITFNAHLPDENGEFQTVVAEKQIFLKSALTADDIQKNFLSDLKNKYSKWGSFLHKLVATKEYIKVVATPIATVNPFCTFDEPIKDCFIKKNRQKEDTSPRLISARLACTHPGCGIRVNLVVANPSGDIELCFRRRVQIERAHNESEFVVPSDEADESDLLTLDHSGNLRVNPEVDIENAPSNYVLRLPSKIEHDEPLNQDVLRKFIMVPAPPARRKLGPNDVKLSATRGSEYLMFIRPIITKYNPNCDIAVRFSKVLRRPYGMRLYLRCKHKDCDFVCKGFINGLTGEVSLEFMNTDAGVEAKLPYCYIRHPPIKPVHTLRHYRLERYMDLILSENMNLIEVMDRFGLSKQQASRVIAGADAKRMLKLQGQEDTAGPSSSPSDPS